ncbi:MAG: ROK family protein [Devosia sp.]
MTPAATGLQGGDIRQGNVRSILSALRQQGPMTKTELAAELGLTRQAVNIIVGEMLAGGYLRDGGRRTGTVGRSAVFYTLAPGAAFGIGLVAGQETIEALLVDFLGAVHYRALAPLKSEPEARRQVVATLASAITSHCRSAGIDADRIAGIGLVGAAAEARLRQMVAEGFGQEVIVERRAAAAAMAELLRAEGTLPRTLVFLSVSDTLDAALVLDGSLHSGLRGAAMRLADMTTSEGKRLGEVACLRTLEVALADASIASGDLYAAEQAAPEIVSGWIARAGRSLGETLALLHLGLDLGAVVIDAALPNSHAHRLAEAVNAALVRALPADMPAPAVLRSRLGRDASALGAAMLPLARRFALRDAERLGAEDHGTMGAAPLA